jgi:hydroxybutyrate-dimer hydrolase
VQSGIAEFLATGGLTAKPMIIVHGRNDDRVPVSFSSRPYAGLNSVQDGERSQLRYIEVANAEHFGTDLPGFDIRMVPLVIYHLRALDLMWDHLTTGARLPDSQVVRTTPRGGEPGKASPLEARNVPPIPAQPRSEDRITIDHGRVGIPD